jgi:hypothetical protein
MNPVALTMFAVTPSQPILHLLHNPHPKRSNSRARHPELHII